MDGAGNLSHYSPPKKRSSMSLRSSCILSSSVDAVSKQKYLQMLMIKQVWMGQLHCLLLDSCWFAIVQFDSFSSPIIPVVLFTV